MGQEPPVAISAAVEGDVDEAVVRRLIAEVGGIVGTVYGKHGKPHLLQRLTGSNAAARRSPWLVVVDLDTDADCPPPARQQWLPDPAPYMCFRIAVRQVESWLLADRGRVAQFFGISESLIPSDPEREEHPKRRMVDLARRSSSPSIRNDMVPEPGSGRLVGPAYTSRMIEFTRTHWRPIVAAQRSNSLERCCRCIRDLVQEFRAHVVKDR